MLELNVKPISVRESCEINNKYADGIFANTCTDELYSEEDIARLEGQGGHVCWAFYLGEKLIGWNISRRISAGHFKMINTAIFKDYRGRGYYQQFLQHVIAYAKQEKFGYISSNHHVTNSAVIIPKLKQGFFITGLKSATGGVFVELTFYLKESAREDFIKRSGFDRII